MATPSITELKDTVELLRNISKEMGDILNQSNSSLRLRRAVNSVEKEILQQTKLNLKASDTLNHASLDAQLRLNAAEKALQSKRNGSQPQLEANVKELMAARREVADTAAALEDSTKHAHNLSTVLDKLGLGRISAAAKEIGLAFESHPILGVAVVLLGLGKQIFNIFKNLDEAAFKFRQEMGVSRLYTKNIDSYAREAAISMAQLGVTGEIAYNAVLGISKALFSSMAVTASLVKDVSLMAASLGISADESSVFIKNLGIADRLSASLQGNMLFFASAMSQAAGVPLKDIMADVNNSVKSSYNFIKKSSVELIKAAVQSRLMGTTLESAADGAKILLDFTASVNSEMAASVLLGESLNLQKARQLAYSRDIIGLNKEILKLATDVNFEQLDPFQQEAVAKALGKSAGELGDMLQAAREQQRIERAINSDPALKKRREELDAMARATKSQAENYGDIARKQLLTESNQTRIKSISDSWNKIMMQLADKFLPAIGATMGFIANNFNTIVMAAIPILAATKLILSVFKSINNIFQNWGAVKAFSGTSKLLRTIGESVVFISNKFKFLGGLIAGGKMFASFTKVVPVLGEVIMALQGLYYSFKRIFSIFDDLKNGNWLAALWKGLTLGPYIVWKVLIKPIGDLLGALGTFILKGILGVSDELYNTLISPFKTAWDWLENTFFGNSPSQLGLLIVKGLEAVGSMILDALVSPFRMAWDIIKNLPLIKNFFGGTKSLDVNIPESAQSIALDKNSPNVSAGANQDNTSYNDKLNDMMMKKLSEVVDSINSLRSDFASGKIRASVMMDGQKLDAQTGRRLEFTGALIA